ncbi:MAG: hypothetical protein K6F37_09255 [Lachnospiraceae bacterium]|nr:hypothetical protein [Lachnospiraceae bacterium]
MKRILSDNSGMARLVIILLAAVIILAAPIIWGIANSTKEDVDKSGCAIAVEAAQKKLDEDYITNPNMTLEEAVKSATSEVRSLDDICPGGGHCVVVEKKDGNGYEIYCELHGKE